MGLSLLLVAAAALPATTAAAQTYDEEADTGTVECVPDCRAGYFCHQGRCISRCNPPCEGDDVCTREGECIPRHPPAAPAAVTVPPATTVYVVPSPQAQTMGPRHQLPDPSFDIDKARRRKAAGGIMMSFGITGIVIAGGLGMAYGFTGDDVFLFIGLPVEVLALSMFIPGLVSFVKNKRRIERHERLSRSALGLAPLALKGGGGLALEMAF